MFPYSPFFILMRLGRPKGYKTRYVLVPIPVAICAYVFAAYGLKLRCFEREREQVEILPLDFSHSGASEPRRESAGLG